MSHFFCWETAELTFTLVHEDGTPATELFEGLSYATVSISQGGSAFAEKTGADVGLDAENATASIRLEQRDTAKFRGGSRDNPTKASCQVNLYYESTERDTTFEEYIDVYRNLHEEVME